MGSSLKEPVLKKLILTDPLYGTAFIFALLIYLLIPWHSLSILCRQSLCAVIMFYPPRCFVRSLQPLTSTSHLCQYSLISHLCSSLAAWFLTSLPVLLLTGGKWIHSEPPMICFMSLLWPWINGCRSAMKYP